MEIISVIVPIFNTIQYLDKCIGSIVSQSYSNLEIILIDDGSSDGSSEKCDIWSEKDNRIKVIHQKNKGLSAARNKGVKESSGDYISFVDSDDYIDKEYYMQMLSVLLGNDSDIVASKVNKEFKNIEESYPFEQKVIYYPEEALKTVISGTTFTVMVWNKLYKRYLIMSNPFPEGRIHEDDFVMYKIISECNKLSFCESAIYHYRQRTHGIIRRSIQERFDDKYCSFFYNQSFILSNYPHLASNMKLLLLRYIVDDYAELIDYNNSKSKELKKRLIEYKSQIRFLLSEIFRFNRWQLKEYIKSSLYFDRYCRKRHEDITKWKGKYEYFD